MDSFQPSFHRSIEDHIATGCESASPGREILFDSPNFLSRRRIPSDEFTSVTTRTGMAHYDRTNVRLAGLVFNFNALVIHAEIVCRNVEQVRSRRVGDRLLVLSSHG